MNVNSLGWGDYPQNTFGAIALFGSVAPSRAHRYNDADEMSTESEIYWTAGFLNERLAAPVSPLGWSVVGAVFDQYALRDPLRFMGYPGANTIPATRLLRGHPYTNVLIFQVLYNPFPDALVPADAVRYFPEGDVSWRKRAPYPRSVFNPRFLLSLLAHFARDPINWSPFNFWQWERYTRRHDQRVAALNARLEHATNPCELFDVIAGANQAHADFAKIHRWSLTYADLFYKLLEHLAGDSAQVLIADVPNLTQRVNDDLRALSDLAARLSLPLDSEAALRQALDNPEFAAAVEGFIRQHGHRSFSLDIAVPTFRDEPAQFLRLLPNAGAADMPAQDWKKAREAARARLPLLERPLFDVVLAFARCYASLRENQRYYWHKSLTVSRRAYLILAEHLRAAKIIDSPESIFYATADELAAYFDQKLLADELAQTIQTRRAAWTRYGQEYLASPARAYPAFLRGDVPLEQTPAAPAEMWQGRGISPGCVRGLARVILDARELGRITPGEILVAPATDPGWTPVFARLGALVLERGGVLAHGAIVAREHHLPAVAGIPNITRELADGDWIEVDGTQGTVRKL
jgi:rifampicin phosphotransferase